MQPNDEMDIRLSLGGDGEAFARLVARHQAAVAKQMLKFTRDRGVLEELVQDVFVEAYRSLRSYRNESPFSHWLSRISTRTGYRYWKSKRGAERERELLKAWARRSKLNDQATTNPVDAAEQLESLLAQLPPRDRMVLLLHYIEGNSLNEVSALTGWSVTMVKVQAFRARQKLRTLFEEVGQGSISDGFKQIDPFANKSSSPMGENVKR